MSRIDELIQRLCPDGVEYKPLGEVGKFLRGSSFQKKHFADEGTSCIHYGQLYTHYGLSAHATLSFLDPEFAKGKKGAKPGDLVIATTSENVEDVGKACAWLGESDIVVSNDAFVFRHNMDPMYASYLFASALFQEQKMRFITGAKVHRISGDSMAKIVLPVPPLEVQREIVRILDAFTELEANLQRELDARKRQYEHFREMMLNFGDEVPWFSLESVCDSITAGGDKPADTIKGQMEPSIEAPYPVFSNGVGSLALYGFSASKRIAVDAVTVSARGTIGHHCVRKGGFTPIIRLITLVPDTDKVLCAYLDAALYRTELLGSSGGIPQLTVPMIKKCAIPVPSLETQQEIVAKLDAMLALQSNLQRQIELTHRQYEHYRDALLDLPRKVA